MRRGQEADHARGAVAPAEKITLKNSAACFHFASDLMNFYAHTRRQAIETENKPLLQCVRETHPKFLISYLCRK